MRQLVYRVQALPQSMIPLVWDFGELSDDIESLYIEKIVQRHVSLRVNISKAHGKNVNGSSF